MTASNKADSDRLRWEIRPRSLMLLVAIAALAVYIGARWVHQQEVARNAEAALCRRPRNLSRPRYGPGTLRIRPGRPHRRRRRARAGDPPQGSPPMRLPKAAERRWMNAMAIVAVLVVTGTLIQRSRSTRPWRGSTPRARRSAGGSSKPPRACSSTRSTGRTGSHALAGFFVTTPGWPASTSALPAIPGCRLLGIPRSHPNERPEMQAYTGIPRIRTPLFSPKLLNIYSSPRAIRVSSFFPSGHS